MAASTAALQQSNGVRAAWNGIAGRIGSLIGDGLPLDEVAAQAGTLGYELLTNLGRRFHRIWKV